MEVTRLLGASLLFNCAWRAAAGCVPGVRLSLREAWDRGDATAWNPWLSTPSILV